MINHLLSQAKKHCANPPVRASDLLPFRYLCGMNQSLKRVSAVLLLAVVAYGVYYVVSLIWFRPAEIGQFFQRYMLDLAQRQPETATRIRPDYEQFTRQLTGRFDAQLDDLSPAGTQANWQADSQALATLNTYLDSRLTPDDSAVSRAFRPYLEHRVKGKTFLFHDYPLNPINGWPGRFERLLVLDHPVDSREHAGAYIDRMRVFPRQADQLIAGMEYRYQKGIVPPKYLLEQSIAEMKAFIAMPPTKNPLYTSFAQKAAKASPWELGEGDILDKMDQIVDVLQKDLYPAYRKLISYTESLLPDAPTHDAEVGLWKLPMGGSAYAWKLEAENGFAVTPDSAWAIGNRGVSYWQHHLHLMLDSAAKAGQLPAGTPTAPAARLAHLISLPCDTSAAGLAQIDTLLRLHLDQMGSYMKAPFLHIPATYLNIKPLAEYRRAYTGPLYTESTIIIAKATGPRQTYVVWTNPAQLAHTPFWRLRSLANEQGIPGKHYLDFWAEANRKRYPTLTALLPSAAYANGWLAWSGYLSSEVLHLYPTDQLLDQAGFAYGQLERYALLMADAGLHHKRWSRQQTIGWLSATLGIQPAEAEAKTDALIVSPAHFSTAALGFERIFARYQQALHQKEGINWPQFHKNLLENGFLGAF